MFRKLVLTFLLVLNTSSQEYIIPIIVQDIPETFMYETFAPIIFKVNVPNHTTSNLIVTGIGDCATSGATNPWCPIHFHLQELRSTLRNQITLDAIIRLTESTTPEFFRIGQECGRIQRHFSSLHTPAARLDNYLNSLLECTKGLTFETNLAPPTEFASKYRQAHTDFLTHYYDAADEGKRATHSVENGLLVVAGWLNYFAESEMWRDAVQICGNQNLPPGLVPEAVLKDALNRIQVLIAPDGYIPSIPIDSSSTYYQLPLTDCTFFNNGNDFLIRILVPIIRKDDWNFKKLQAIPFRHTFEGKDYMCINKELEDSKLVQKHLPTMNVLEYNCDEFICKTNDQLRPLRKSCASEVLNFQSEIELVTRCPLECQLLDNFQLPAVFLGNQKYYLVGRTTDLVQIECPGDLDENYFPPTEGALEIQIRCDCVLKHGSTRLKIDGHCASQNSVRNVQSIHFSGTNNELNYV